MSIYSKGTGFTLLEMLVVLVILALVLTLIPPMLSNVIQSTKVKASIRDIAAGLKYARNQAVTKQKETILMLNAERKYYIIDNKRHRLDLPDNTKLSMIAADTEQLSRKEAAIRFFPDGSSTGGQVELKNNNYHYLVDVNWLTGKIRILP